MEERMLEESSSLRCRRSGLTNIYEIINLILRYD
jgi:hypothetical protein